MSINKLSKMSVADVLNLLDGEQPAVPTTTRRGRPTTGTARDGASRQRDLRASYERAVNEQASDTWTDSMCRYVINSQKWRGTAVDEVAWTQLGKLRGFIKQ